MIKIENVEVVGWEHAIRGMRNPKNSWDRSDSVIIEGPGESGYSYMRDINMSPVPVYKYPDESYGNDGRRFGIGPNDHKLMTQLTAGGPVHAKYRRMITVYLDITAPLYWWKEFDTYKVGTVANSCSTMHKIHEKEFTLEDFSHEHLDEVSITFLEDLINHLNDMRAWFNEMTDNDAAKKEKWWQMIQLLPSSYNQKRTIMLNYEVLAGIYPMRKNHKLDEWVEFCKWIESLPYSEIITGKTENAESSDGEEALATPNEMRDILTDRSKLQPSKGFVLENPVTGSGFYTEG